jgi:glucose-1-phosphate adenylyltransferase
VLSPGVYVAEGAIVRDSVILNNTWIESGAVVDRCIIDKNVRVSAGAKVGDGDNNAPNELARDTINTGITLVGKGSIIPPDVTIGRNVVIYPDSTEADFGRKKKIASGKNIGTSQR